MSVNMRGTVKNGTINRNQVLEKIGYPDGCEPPLRIRKLFDEFSQSYTNLLTTDYSFTFRDIVEVKDNQVMLEDMTILESNVIAGLCERCEKIAVFVLTIGPLIEQQIDNLAKSGKVVQATVLDALGSCAAENLAVSLEEEVRHLFAMQGKCLSRRFSPGYCDWNVTQQEQLFTIMAENTAGVRITEEYLMMPRKSSRA